MAPPVTRAPCTPSSWACAIAVRRTDPGVRRVQGASRVNGNRRFLRGPSASQRHLPCCAADQVAALARPGLTDARARVCPASMPRRDRALCASSLGQPARPLAGAFSRDLLSLLPAAFWRCAFPTRRHITAPANISIGRYESRPGWAKNDTTSAAAVIWSAPLRRCRCDRGETCLPGFAPSSC